MMTVTIPISDEILFAIKKDVKNIQSDFMQALAIQYFKENRLSLGLASHMAGLGKNDFVTLLSKQNIDIYQYTSNELDNEFNLVSRMLG
ncbi:MAG: UPF0175 family protein [Defluviitaleaceae bacterium]|nr:UPF0175 family protein [Defluviitaleaceae bacterium]